jgi:hypothetical protein
MIMAMLLGFSLVGKGLVPVSMNNHFHSKHERAGTSCGVKGRNLHAKNDP